MTRRRCSRLPAPRSVRRTLAFAATLALAACAPASHLAHYTGLPQLLGLFHPRLAPDTTARAGGEVVVAAGDIGFCGLAGDAATAALLGRIPGTVLTLGDNAYPDGTPEDFARCFDPTWGRHKARMWPTPGNHEWHDGRGAGYFAYFGARAGEPRRGWYSLDVGRGAARWHLVALNSNLRGPMMEEQARWLRADLAAHPARCTLAFFHHSLWISAADSTPEVRPLWRAMYDAGGDVVLSAHWHVYERFGPTTPDGRADSTRGIPEFVVGTGGAGLDRFGRRKAAHSTHRDRRHYGVLRMELYDGRYRWEFVGVNGRVYDRGDGWCH